jgi:positive regulator of sigma E activity
VKQVSSTESNCQLIEGCGKGVMKRHNLENGGKFANDQTRHPWQLSH